MLKICEHPEICEISRKNAKICEKYFSHIHIKIRSLVMRSIIVQVIRPADAPMSRGHAKVIIYWSNDCHSIKLSLISAWSFSVQSSFGKKFKVYVTLYLAKCYSSSPGQPQCGKHSIFRTFELEVIGFLFILFKIN